MAAVREFALPDLGEGLTEATVVRWLVEVGEVVVVDQPVVEVETAKAVVEVPCPYPGVVTSRYGEEGAEIPVGAPLVTVAVSAPAAEAARGADADGVDGAAGTAPAAAPPAAPPRAAAAERGVSGARAGGESVAEDGEEGSGNVLVGYGTTTGSTRRRRARRGNGTPPHPGFGEHEPVDGECAGPVAVISPLVRRIAREHQLDLRQVVGSGPDGLIVRADVERALRRPDGHREAAASGPGPVDGDAVAPPGRRQGTPTFEAARAASNVGMPPAAPVRPLGSWAHEAERVPLRGVSAVAAEKLSRSRREIPDASCWVDADATEFLELRKSMNRPGAPRVSVLGLLARVCTAALARFPELNASFDAERREIVRFAGVHLGFAAQTERGLLVPVVRDAQRRSTEGLSAELDRLTGAAREGTLTPADLAHGTFTLNNYGVFGVDGSTPILNHPEAAMLGVGRISPRPWVHQDALAVRQVVQLSLTFDHRVCDGGTAGGFLRFVADCLEQPGVLIRAL